VSVVVRNRDVPLNKTYEPGLHIEMGVTKDTAGSKDILLGHTIFPPGNKNQWHVHENCEAAQYVIKGRLRVKWLEDGQVKDEVCEPGDFVYIHKGEPHTQENASQSEPVEIIFTYSGANSTETAGTVFISAPVGDLTPQPPSHSAGSGQALRGKGERP
jgi:uncharacterized RmlC-like cupin family protein